MSRSTVTSTLKALKSMGYVDYEPTASVHLTGSGEHIGRDIAHRHIVIQEFFQHILQLEPNVSNDVACELEHVIPPDVIRRLGQFVLYLRSREDDWKNWQEDYKEIRLEHIQSNTDKDLVRNAPPHARHAHPDDGAGRTAEKSTVSGLYPTRRQSPPAARKTMQNLRSERPPRGLAISRKAWKREGPIRLPCKHIPGSPGWIPPAPYVASRRLGSLTQRNPGLSLRQGTTLRPPPRTSDRTSTNPTAHSHSASASAVYVRIPSTMEHHRESPDSSFTIKNTPDGPSTRNTSAKAADTSGQK